MWALHLLACSNYYAYNCHSLLYNMQLAVKWDVENTVQSWIIKNTYRVLGSRCLVYEASLALFVLCMCKHNFMAWNPLKSESMLLFRELWSERRDPQLTASWQPTEKNNGARGQHSFIENGGLRRLNNKDQIKYLVEASCSCFSIFLHWLCHFRTIILAATKCKSTIWSDGANTESGSQVTLSATPLL